MAFYNAQGEAISFDCSELIEELKADIVEFGDNIILEVVTEKVEDVTIYKDYFFIDEDDSVSFALSANESLQQIVAGSLLHLYEEENGII